MSRKTIDCRSMPNEVGCTLTISGEEDEVLRAATQHAIDVHGHAAGPELTEGLRSMLAEAAASTPRARPGGATTSPVTAAGPFLVAPPARQSLRRQLLRSSIAVPRTDRSALPKVNAHPLGTMMSGAPLPRCL